jgi:hypothetical protein
MPAPIEVDRVYATEWGEDQNDPTCQNWTAEEKVEVDYMGEACRRCGGMGHCPREHMQSERQGQAGGKGSQKRARKRQRERLWWRVTRGERGHG